MGIGPRFGAIIAVGLLQVTVSTVAAKYSGGTGEPNGPYQIATAADLIALGNEPNDYAKCFILTADIDLDPDLPGGRVFDRAVIAPGSNDPQGNFEGIRFSGTFNGHGHRISHLTIRGGACLGLFGSVDRGAIINDLGLVDINIIGSGDYVGAMIGMNLGTVTRSCSTGVVYSAGSDVGGLVGMNWPQATVSQCCSACEVSGSNSVGGLVGYNAASAIRQCYSLGEVQGDSCVGGLVGYSFNGTIRECYSAGAVYGRSLAGGLAGYLQGSLAYASFWDKENSGQATDAAGSTERTTAEMKTSATFSIWTDSAGEVVWTIDDGNDYPRLSWEHRPGKPLTRLSDLVRGSGTKDSPFLIYTPEELNLIGLYPGDWNKCFLLMADIDMSGIDGKDGRPAFNAIAPNLDTQAGSAVRGGGGVAGGRGGGVALSFVGTPFTGLFDGGGHKIRRLTIKDARGGLFGGLGAGAQVTRLGVVDVNIAGSVTGIGGLAGWNSGTISQCFSSGAVIGGSYVGGLVGINGSGAPNISQCYSTCSVAATNYAGGLAGGNMSGTVACCYCTGAVTTKNTPRGLIAINTGTVTSCFWDTQTSGQTVSAGGTGKTTAQMQTAKTFLDAGWDFVGETKNGTADIWRINEGKDYPRLGWEE